MERIERTCGGVKPPLCGAVPLRDGFRGARLLASLLHRPGKGDPVLWILRKRVTLRNNQDEL